MIEVFRIVYGQNDSILEFTVDTEKLSRKLARVSLYVFEWKHSIDTYADPILELIKKYALEIIPLSWRLNENQIKDRFKHTRGFLPIDGTEGISFKLVKPFEFSEKLLLIGISEVKKDD